MDGGDLIGALEEGPAIAIRALLRLNSNRRIWKGMGGCDVIGVAHDKLPITIGNGGAIKR